MNDVSVEHITDEALIMAHEWHMISYQCYSTDKNIGREIITGEKDGSIDSYRHWHIVDALFNHELKRRVNIKEKLHEPPVEEK